MKRSGDAAAAPGDAGGPLSRCLSLDLEVGKRDGRIHAFAGVRPDLDEAMTFPARRAALAAARAKLDEPPDGADFVLGHNLIGFDLPHLPGWTHSGSTRWPFRRTRITTW